MKASEVLARYAAGERNFQRVNLRGQSFKGENLAGADFSKADLRSTNFAGATLTKANFTDAKCGLQRRWTTVLTMLSFLLAAISGLFSTFTGTLILSIFNSSSLESQIASWVSLLMLAIFLLVTIRQGTRAGTYAVAVAVVTLAALGVVSGVALAVSGTAAVVATGIVVATVVVATGVVIVAAVFVAAAVATAEATAGTYAGAVVATGVVVVVTVGVVAATAAETYAVAAALAGAVAAALAGAVAAAIIAVLAGTYIAWRAMKGNPRDAWVRSLAIAFSTIYGTSFRGADLTDADFSFARLKSTEMRDATLTRVRWYGAEMLDRVRPGNSYLQSTQVRQWLIGKGVNKNFDGQKLQGVNFQGADLTDASFIDSNLSEANLQDADLSGAKLVQTQLDQTDFTGANLTGAFIEDWGITSNTVLDEVKCEYIFMRLPTKNNPEPCRKPDNRSEVFEVGDFADFIKPIFDTLDLYHNQGVDPRAIAISWKQLAENNPDAKLQFASMEVKGQDNLLLRLKTEANADLSQLSADYFETYNQIKALAEAESQKLIAAQDNRIQALENMVNTALKRPGFYAENYSHQGDVMSGEQRRIEISGGTIHNSGAGAFSLGDFNGTVANTINQLPAASNSNEPGIKELLTQLQAAVKDPQLSAEDQKQVLDQVQTLAEAGQNPQDQTMQKKAERAVGFLEVIAKGVEPASKLAKACASVLPKILAFFV